MSKPVILVFADTEEERDALINELYEKLDLNNRTSDNSIKLRSTRDSFGDLMLSSLTSHS